MALLSLQDLRIAFGDRPVLDQAALQIHRGERIGLVGRNGEGKSTLLKIVAGLVDPDEGAVAREPGLRVAYLPQAMPEVTEGTAAAVIRDGVPAHADPDAEVLRLTSLLELDPDQPVGEQSGGQKRRTWLARALAADPDLLLLDEPTNHLDIASIEWLESFLMRWPGTLLFVTHDRTFLQRLATRIVELDRGRLTSWSCDYPTYLRRKDELLAAEETRWEQEDRKLAEEEAWVRQGIKARRTRNEGRVRALERLRAERALRRERVGQVRMAIQESERSGRKVIEAEDVSFAWPDQVVVRDFSSLVTRGDVVGLIGPNGCGKTTLLRLLLGELEPDEGRVRHGERLSVRYFDQHRAQLDGEATVAESVAFGSDHVTTGSGRRHIYGYLEDFLFSPDRARQPVRSLSGGERNRLLLARLFSEPANVLVLDEPTNDLDAETLELLEGRLAEFAGTVLLVSHDRSFLDNLCTNTLVFEGAGRVKEYVGGYSDWKRVVEGREEGDGARPVRRSKTSAPSPRSKGRNERSDRPARLSWKERQEWEALPSRIEALEAELGELHERMGDPDFYRGDADAIREASERAGTLPSEIDALYARWSELDERA